MIQLVFWLKYQPYSNRYITFEFITNIYDEVHLQTINIYILQQKLQVPGLERETVCKCFLGLPKWWSVWPQSQIHSGFPTNPIEPSFQCRRCDNQRFGHAVQQLRHVKHLLFIPKEPFRTSFFWRKLRRVFVQREASRTWSF